MALKGKNLIIVILGALSLILAGALIYSQWGGNLGTETLKPQKAANLALDYINNKLLKGRARANLTGTVSEENGLYKFQVNLGNSKFYSYVTKDGKLLFPQGFVMVKKEEKKKNVSLSAKCQSVSKSPQPVLEAFVVSYCPFGMQMQRILTGVAKNIPSLGKDIRIEYIGAVKDGKITLMHGDKEAKENLRQICLREEQSEKFFPYIDCHIKKGGVESCLKSTGVDEKKLENCENDKKRGLAYAQKDFKRQNKYGVGGSPTLIMNGKKANEFDFGGRNAEALKTLLCCGFSQKPDFCSKSLTLKLAPTGFSESDRSGGYSSGSLQ